ncbi:PdxH Pyridoxamine-phosphate oxidase [Acidimicrobiia bacterium]
MSQHPQLDKLRLELQARGVRRDELDADPIVQFSQWFDISTDAGIHEPEAMIVSSVDAEGMPSSRHVLLKGVDHGFVFFTNYESQKGRELIANPKAAICFPWNILSRQIRIIGAVEKVSAAESDEYFATRPRGSRVGAWASLQSEVIDGRHVLEERLAETEARFGDGDIPRPPHWGGFRVLPQQIEFWQARPMRLHDRFRYTADPSVDGGWRIERLSP